MEDQLDIILGDGANVATNSNVVLANSGEVPSEIRITQLKTALEDAKINIENACDESKGVLYLIIFISFCVVCFGFAFAICLLDAKLPDKWTWQVIYFTAIRITFLSSIFAVANFCFKLIRSYLQIYQKNIHNVTIVKSMASLVESASKYEQRNEIYNKLLDIIIEFGETGLLIKTEDIKLQATDNISEIIKKLTSKSGKD